MRFHVKHFWVRLHELAILVQRLAEIVHTWDNIIGEDDYPYADVFEGSPYEIYDRLEEEILDIAGYPNGLRNHRRSANLVADHGKNDSPVAPWLTVFF